MKKLSIERYLKDDFGDKYRYALAYLYRGWDETVFSNDIEELDKLAKGMMADNSGKPLIIVDGNDEVVREYAKKLR